MQMDKARELRLSWGKKHCKHPSFVKEYYLGADTGDKVCTQCGETFSPEEYKKLLADRRKKKKASHGRS